MNATPSLLVAAASAVLWLTGCSAAPAPEITVAERTPGAVPSSLLPTPTPTPSRTPTPTPLVTTVAAKGPLKCRRATPAEVWLVSETGPAWTVEIGDGWRIVAAMMKVAGGPAEPTSMVSNGERHNYTYQRTSEPFRVRVLPVVLPDGFDAIELAESCARRGSVGR